MAKDKKGKKGKKGLSKKEAKALASQALAESIDNVVKPKKKSKKSGVATPAELAALLRVGPDFQLAAVDTSSTPGFKGDSADGEAALAAADPLLDDLQERLYAAAKGGAKDSVLLVIQGMDTSGKGGIMRHVIGSVDPQGIRLTAFKTPTAEERAKGFLWRIRQALPAPGLIGVFDRSQYEDVLVVRVKNLVTRAVWARRYAQINAMEAKAAASGTHIIKVMLHISADEQKARLAERLDRADKHWKYRPGDLDDRALWPEFQEAYQDALVKCSTDAAPWYVVPADKKWYARWAVQQLLLGELEQINPQWPAASFDVEAEQARLAEL